MTWVQAKVPPTPHPLVTPMAPLDDELLEDDEEEVDDEVLVEDEALEDDEEVDDEDVDDALVEDEVAPPVEDALVLPVETALLVEALPLVLLVVAGAPPPLPPVPPAVVDAPPFADVPLLDTEEVPEEGPPVLGPPPPSGEEQLAVTQARMSAVPIRQGTSRRVNPKFMKSSRVPRVTVRGGAGAFTLSCWPGDSSA